MSDPFLKLDDYQQAAARTRAGDASIELAALGLAGESGEFADSVKKVLFHGHPQDRDHMIEELGDILWYIAAGADALGTTMSAIALRNIEKLQKRYPDGFTTERSLNRESEAQP